MKHSKKHGYIAKGTLAIIAGILLSVAFARDLEDPPPTCTSDNVPECVLGPKVQNGYGCSMGCYPVLEDGEGCCAYIEYRCPGETDVWRERDCKIVQVYCRNHGSGFACSVFQE